MGLNFPTAFWKKQPVDASVITWETGLWWSYGNEPAEGENFPLKQSSNFSFNVDGSEYYPAYDLDSISSDSKAYFGWFLDGGIDDSLGFQDLSAYHKEKPWTIEGDGLKVSLENEADHSTALDSGLGGAGNENTSFLYSHYNSFIQSGEATGTFTLDSSATLQMKVSGLGQDSPVNADDETLSSFYDSMTLHLFHPNETEELICSGSSPRDDRFATNSDLKDQKDLYDNVLLTNMDMQQVKLYAGDDLTTIINYQQTPTTDTSKGEPRAYPSQWVEQTNRIAKPYTNTNGTATFSKSLTAVGDYQLRIKTSTVDGNFNSGAFYGFTFSFS
jgi:hypothetical protein